MNNGISNNSLNADGAGPRGWNGMGSGNLYAVEMSDNIRSFDDMYKEDFTSITHKPPLSFGITARKNFGKRLGVESGLVYTYLSSNFEWTEWDINYTAHQSLHYLGIPVNMVAYLWNPNPSWRIYFSGGFTGEKGLRAIYTQHRKTEWQWNNAIYTTTVKKKIDGLQWSLNSAVGVNYKFHKEFGIYFEPRVGYSFDNNQPISIRTEWPVYIGINVGLNYEL
jgi:hypothetical protein